MYVDENGRFRYKDYMTDASGYGHPDHDFPEVGIAKTSFCTLWESIYGTESWQSNPWVWVIEFERIEKLHRDVHDINVGDIALKNTDR